MRFAIQIRIKEKAQKIIMILKKETTQKMNIIIMIWEIQLEEKMDVILIWEIDIIMISKMSHLNTINIE